MTMADFGLLVSRKSVGVSVSFRAARAFLASRAALQHFTRSITIGISRSTTDDMSFSQRHYLGIRLMSSRDPASLLMYGISFGSAAMNCA